MQHIKDSFFSVQDRDLSLWQIRLSSDDSDRDHSVAPQTLGMSVQCVNKGFNVFERLLQRTHSSIRAETWRAEPLTAEEQKSISLLPERHDEMQLGR